MTLAPTQHHGLVSLLTWLRDQVAEGRAGRGLERTRRLDSDAAAVQLVTIHASKGLEYPVVYLPAVSDRHVSEPELPRFHDDEGRRCRNVGAGGPGWADHVRRAQEEDAGEWLRLLYVALTRAQSQVVCWWSPTKNTIASPLHRMLMRPIEVGSMSGSMSGSTRAPRSPASRVSRPTTRPSRCSPAWRDRGGPTPEPARPAELTGPGPAADVHALGVRSFTRTVDAAWRRTSYSSLSAVRPRRSCRAVASEPEVVGKDDEGLAPDFPSAGFETVAATTSSTSGAADVPSPMADLPVGATFGSLVHAVLEHVDPTADDLRAELLTHIDEQRGWWPVDARPRGAGRRAGRGVRLAARRTRLAAVGGHPAGRPTDRPVARDGLRDRAGRRRRARRRHARRPARHSSGRPRAPARDDTCPTATPCAPTPRPSADRSATSRCAATSPGRSTWCCACPRPAARASTSSTTRPTGSVPSTSR